MISLRLISAIYGTYRYEVIDGRVWLYASDLKYRMSICEYFDLIHEMDEKDVRRARIETPLGSVVSYLVSIDGAIKLLKNSTKRGLYKHNFIGWLEEKIKTAEEKEKKNGTGKYQYGNHNSRRLH